MVFDYFGGKVLFYLLGGSLMAMGFHPVAGHFISGKCEEVEISDFCLLRWFRSPIGNVHVFYGCVF